MKKFKRALLVKEQIKAGLWEVPVVEDWHSDDNCCKIFKTDTEFSIWMGNGPMFCKIYEPKEYDAFGFLGKFVVWYYANKLVAADRNARLKKTNAFLSNSIDENLFK